MHRCTTAALLLLVIALYSLHTEGKYIFIFEQRKIYVKEPDPIETYRK